MHKNWALYRTTYHKDDNSFVAQKAGNVFIWKLNQSSGQDNLLWFLPTVEWPLTILLSYQKLRMVRTGMIMSFQLHMFVTLFNESYPLKVYISSTHFPSICDRKKAVWYEKQCLNVSQLVHEPNIKMPEYSKVRISDVTPITKIWGK